MSAYEMEKSFDRMAELMRKNAQAVMIQNRYTVREQAQETLDETIAHDEKVDKRFDNLELDLEGLSGIAIAASNKDRQQPTLLEQVLARLTDLEKTVHPPPPPPTTSQDVDVAVGGASPPTEPQASAPPPPRTPGQQDRHRHPPRRYTKRR